MSVTDTAVIRAVALLRATGAHFVILPPGAAAPTLSQPDLVYALKTAAGGFGPLLPSEKSTPTKPARRRVYRFAHMGYVAALQGAVAGDLLKWTLNTRDEADALRACVSAAACKLRGKGSCITSVSGNLVECLCVV